MKFSTLTITAVLLIFLSCKNGYSKSQSETKTNSAEVKTETSAAKKEVTPKPEPVVKPKPEPKTFDWSITQRLKSALISELQKESVSNDKLVVKFLEDYSKTENEFNEILYSQSNYNSLSKLASPSHSKLSDDAIEFKKNVEAIGFEITQAEGMIYLVGTSDYIKSGLTEVLDTNSKEFLNLYCQEIDKKCCKDGGIIISKELLVKRTLSWGNMLEKSQGPEYKRVAESKFSDYLLLLFAGIDNTPSFDWSTGKFNPDLLKFMKSAVSENPTAKASEKFTEYIALLEQSDLKRSNEIDTYLNTLRK